VSLGSESYAGVGFAVPVDTVNRVVPQLIAQGKCVRPVLGIQADEALNQIVEKRLGSDRAWTRRSPATR